MEFKDFSRTSPNIQGLFKTVRTLPTSKWEITVLLIKNDRLKTHEIRIYFNFVFDTTELCIELAFTMDHFYLSNCFRATQNL